MSEAQSGQETNVPGLSDLFVSFLKLGTVAFGGPAMVAYAHDMAVDKKKWLDDQSFKDGVSLPSRYPAPPRCKWPLMWDCGLTESRALLPVI